MILYSLYGLLTDAGAREKRWGPGSSFLPRVGRGVCRRRAVRAWRGCRPGLRTAVSLLRSPSLPLLSSPPLCTGGPGCLASWTQRFVQVRAGQGSDGPAGRAPAAANSPPPSLPPPSPATPTNFPVLAVPPVSAFGISCLNSSFCLLHFKRSLL